GAVVDQVDQDLLQPQPVAAARQRRSGQLQPQLDALPGQLRPLHLGQVPQQRSDVQRLQPRRLRLQPLPGLLDNGGAAGGFLINPLQDGQQGVRRVLLLQAQRAAFSVVADGGKRLVELVGQPSGQLAQQAPALRFRQLLLPLPQPQLGSRQLAAAPQRQALQPQIMQQADHRQQQRQHDVGPVALQRLPNLRAQRGLQRMQAQVVVEHVDLGRRDRRPPHAAPALGLRQQRQRDLPR